jgi:diaminopimelate decarboxylase
MSIDFQALANEYGTPLYVYDFDYMREQYRKLKSSFEGSKSLICYAVKANSNLSVIQNFANEGSGADCVSIGEVKRALLAGIKPYKIIFSGVGKSDSEIKEALELKILMINVESQEELKRVEAVASSLGIEARVSIRVNPNVDPKTHPYISTGLHENKFGVDLDMAKRMYIYAKNSSSLDPVGVHFHIGSQLTELSPIAEAAQIVADLVKSLKAIDIDIKFFDVGGGLGIAYDNEELIDEQDYADAIIKATKGLDVTLVCEPGRYMVGNGGYLLTKVLYEKQNGNRRFTIVDAAMNDLLRPSLYSAYHKIELLSKKDTSLSKTDIVGPICESGDFLAKGVDMPKLESGDLLVVHSAGAYGFTMASNYNTRSKAAEVACEGGDCRLIRKREEFDNLVELERLYLKGQK